MKLPLFLIAASFLLGACSSLPSLPSFSGDDNPEAESAEVAGDALSNEQGEGAEAVVLSPEEQEQQALLLKANELLASVNAFELDKQAQKPLSSAQMSMVQNAMNALANANIDGAKTAIQRVIDDPDFIASPHSSVWVLRGDIHRSEKDTEQAINDYKAAIAIAANNYQAHNRLAQLYRNAGDFVVAKQHYDEALQAWPGNAATYRNRGILFDLYIGDKKSALADYQLYKAFLDIELSAVEAPSKSLLREQRLAGQWITDIKRQIKAIEREKANG
ncbi:tetratricopeptide repeat protein [Glaciecola sp. MH2013]|nr:tetratricopeptide repeat protein [Glaciecola sp. MH2013]